MKKLKIIKVVLFFTCFSWVTAQEKQVVDDNATIVMTKVELENFLTKIKELRKQRLLKCQRNKLKGVENKVVVNENVPNITPNTSDETHRLLLDLNQKVNQLLYRNNSTTTYVPLGGNKEVEVKYDNEHLKYLQDKIEDLEAKIDRKNAVINSLDKRLVILEAKLLYDVATTLAKPSSKSIKSDTLSQKPSTTTEVKVVEVSKKSKYDELMKKYNGYKTEYFFENNSSKITITDYPSIKKTANIVNSETPYVRIQLKGFASKKGSVAYNVKLSKRRAEAVKQAFVKEGVNSSFIEILPLGEDEISSESQARRVEVHLFIK